MSDLQALEYILSGAGAALMILLAVRFFALRRLCCVEVSGFAFCVLAAMHMLADHTVPFADQGLLGQGLLYFGTYDTVVFWILAQTFFEDRFQLRPVHLLPFAIMAVLWFLPIGLEIHYVFVSLLMVHVVVIGLMGYQCDLVPARRWFRLALAILVPLTVITTAITSLTLPADSEVVALVDAGKFAALALLFAIWMTRLDDVLLSRVTAPAQDGPPGMPAADRLELDRVQQVVASGICFEPGLTIGAFAMQVGLPEHRVRKLINQGLGYRNFAAFLNDHRIDEAKRRLADPQQAREQIISHAFALGYNSLAPFNRAFRERVGKSPTEYRAERLEEAIA